MAKVPRLAAHSVASTESLASVVGVLWLVLNKYELLRITWRSVRHQAPTLGSRNRSLIQLQKLMLSFKPAILSTCNLSSRRVPNKPDTDSNNIVKKDRRRGNANVE